MKRSQKYADHVQRQIIEPLDMHGIILIAKDRDRVVGTVRVNLGCDAERGRFDYYDDLYGLRAFGPYYPAQLSITTKLMIAPEFRRGVLAVQMAIECFKIAISHGVRFDIIDCNPPLKEFFERLGYRQLQPDIFHPEYGRVCPMILALLDVAHLNQVCSPFRDLAVTVKDDTDSIAFFRDNLATTMKARRV